MSDEHEELEPNPDPNAPEEIDDAVQSTVDSEKYADILSRTKDENLALRLFSKWKCLTDLYFLATKVLGLDKAQEGKRKRIDPQFHRWMCSIIQVPQDTLLLVPRGHMKSTFAKIRAIQIILQNPNIRIGLFSRTSGLVEAQLADIRNMIISPLLVKLFPEIITFPSKRFLNWERATANEMTIKRDPTRGRIPQEAQIEAFGSLATITGRHYDVIIMDDILNEQSCSTAEQIRKIRDWYSYIQSIKDPEGYEYMIGTRYSFSDLYGEVISSGWYGDRVYTREATEDGRPIYSFFTLKALHKIKQRMGAKQYASQYENRPISSTEQIFSPPFQEYELLPPGKYNYYMTVDPAATVEKWSDDTAIVVCAVDELQTMFVIDAYGYKRPPNEIAQIIVQKIARYGVKKVGIEYGLQSALKYIIDIKIQEYERTHNLRLNTIFEKINNSGLRISKADRINKSIAGLVREGKIILHRDLVDLKQQMEYFPQSTHDDIVDALAMQMQIVPEFSRRMFFADAYEEVHVQTFMDLFQKKHKSGWENRFAQ